VRLPLRGGLVTATKEVWQEMAETQTYHGGCHCGRVRYEVSADLSSTITCNCSICQKTGTVLTFVPADKFKLVSGEEHLSDYQFNRNVIHHLFCKTCGIRSFARGAMPDGSPVVAVNVRCLDGFELSQVTPSFVDGKSF
jgi:hypothetical protein